MIDTYLGQPSVTCDVRLGQIINDIELDAAVIAEIMRAHGVEEARIAAHTIHFSSEAVIDEKGTITFGTYDYPDNTTTVYLGSRCEASDELWGYAEGLLLEKAEGRRADIPEGLLERITSGILSVSCNETLLHETHHAIEGNTVSEEEWLASRKKHMDALEWAQEKKKALAMGIATLAMIAPFVEVHKDVPPNEIKISFIAGIVIAGLSAVWAALPKSKNHRHKHYRASSWEVAASEFAKEFVADGTEPSELPLRIKFNNPLSQSSV